MRANSSNPEDAPIVKSNYLKAEQDQRITLAALRLACALLNRHKLSSFFKTETIPGHEVKSDDELLDYARQYGNTGYHLIGTCHMGLGSDVQAVVDDQLLVHGLENLRVIVASIMPMLPSANTFDAKIAIAEKGADLIKGLTASCTE